MLTKKVSDYIARHGLLQADERVLVALSGGADSVALLCLLLDLGYVCHAVHCNFNLRGEESDRDEAFVRSLCTARKVALDVVRFDTRTYAREQHISIEMAARELRYQSFEQLRVQHGAAVVAVAHHRNDSVETFLLNLIRGTGVQGLRGIQPRNGRIIRPLLCLSRDELLSYLKEKGQPYVTDSTNLEDAYTRNKIRLHLIPLMQQLNPSIVPTLSATAERMAEVASIYNKVMEEARGRVLTELPHGVWRIDIPRFRQEEAQQSLLFELLSPCGFKSAQLTDIAASVHGEPGRRFYSDTHEVIRDRQSWLVYPRRPVADTVQLELSGPEGEVILPGTSLKLAWQCRSVPCDFHIPTDRNIACVDADKLTFPLVVRHWRQGDRFVPLGMTGQKKLSDYMTNRKYTRRQKEEQWLVCSRDTIVWLAGERLDNRYRLEASTRRVCVLHLKHA